MENLTNPEENKFLGVAKGEKSPEQAREEMDAFNQFKFVYKEILLERGVKINELSTRSNLFDVFIRSGSGEKDFKGEPEKLELFRLLQDILPIRPSRTPKEQRMSVERKEAA